LLNPLFRLALLSGAKAAVQFHIKRCTDLDDRDTDGLSPLLLAVMTGNTHCCELLLEAGANPTLTGPDGLDALNLAVRNGRVDLEKVIVPYLPSPRKDREVEQSHEDLWIEEPEPRVPQNDSSCVDSAYRLQKTLADHVFVDDDQDWSEVAVELPEVLDYGREVDDQLVSFLNYVGRIGRSSYDAIDGIAADLAGGDEAPAMASHLLLRLGDLGVILDENGPLPGDHPSAEDRPVVPLSERLDFLQDLENPSVDPFNCFVRDLGRRQLLSPEREAQLAIQMEQGLDRAAQELSSCAPAVSEILRIGERVIHGDIAIDEVLDTDRAQRGLSEPDVFQQAPLAEIGNKDVQTRFVAQIEALRRMSKRGSKADIRAALPDLHLSSRMLESLAEIVMASGQKAEAEVVLEALETVRRGIDEFFHCNTRLVFQIARRYVRATMPLSDLVQEGNIGLLKAIQRFDWRRGYRFSTFATWWVRQAISRAVANDSRLVRLPVHVCESLRIFSRTIGALRQELGKEPSFEEIAVRLEWPIRKVYRYAAYIPDVTSLSALNDEVGSEDLIRVGYIDDLADRVYKRDLSLCVERVLKDLNPREADVIRSRFGIGTDDEQTLEQIGARSGVTRERIRQIETKALTLLRHPGSRAMLRGYVQDCAFEKPRFQNLKPNRAALTAGLQPKWDEVRRRLGRTSRRRTESITVPQAPMVQA
jgi:RNA polymerase primary sigma factor